MGALRPKPKPSAAQTTKEMVVYGPITVGTGYITSVSFLLAILAIATPYMWYAETNHQAFGLQYNCANNPLPPANYTWECHEHPSKLSGDLKDDTTFCLGFYWGSIGLLMLSTIHLNYGVCTNCLSPCGMFINAMLQLFSAAMFIVVMCVVLGVTNINADVDSIKAAKELANGSWSFQYYAAWVVVGLQLLNALLITAATMTETVAPVAAATVSTPQYAPAPATSNNPCTTEPSVPMAPPSQAPLRTVPEMDDGRSCNC